jgi:putative addiction module CopG family antidote
MGEVRKVDVSLSDDLAADIELAIKNGTHASLNDVIDDALKLWSEQNGQKLVRLRALIDEGMASGEPKDVTPEWFDNVYARAMARLDETQRS